MSVALKCDLCKKIFQVKSDHIPNVLTFAKIEIGNNDLDLVLDLRFMPNGKIIKNKSGNVHGTYIFNMCEECYKKIENLIVDEGGTDESFA